MKFYQIKEISRMTSLTIRSLQYYDDIGLLKPAKRSEAGYRLYSEADLLQLQQIITLKFLGFGLTAIKAILGDPGFDVMRSVGIQSRELADKALTLNEASSLLTYIASQMESGQPVNWHSTAKIIEILEKKTMSRDLLAKYQKGAEKSELGKTTAYDQSYNPNRLYMIPRAGKREEIGIDPQALPFKGFDCWNHYEVSWLNAKGKPVVAIAEVVYDCSSPYLVESKSLKLYFNSFNNTQFEGVDEVVQLVKKDLQERIGAEVFVRISLLSEAKQLAIQSAFSGECLDALDVTCTVYLVEPKYLSVEDSIVEEVLYSDLLKSNCLVTNQPDWGSVQIAYKGKKINREGLLKYLVSYRNHNEFHEQCIERIFVDILRICKPSSLTVYGRYTRRGGLDINPYRSTESSVFDEKNIRLIRQ
ncbi:MAG: NADPH-dependent 7-cyano-7-deazaguanine reductase QueF [Gammaproteobacteria bacterium]|nr:NADPH-dependent 7-cyano-7-deazaguanine reductase QueF [Gammaproteobacteria bacterium]